MAQVPKLGEIKSESSPGSNAAHKASNNIQIFSQEQLVLVY